jgi:putative transcriptional regulator
MTSPESSGTSAQPLAGRLLVSTPWLGDPNFRRTVVLLLDHSDDGAFGVVLNRPTGVDVGSVLPGWDTVIAEPGGLYQGGPVGLDGALGLAVLADGTGRVGSAGDGVDRVVGPFAIVDLDGDPVLTSAGVEGIRIFAGHSGWGAGQLEEEISAGGWYVLDAEPQDAVTPAPDDLWRRVLRRQGGDLAIVSLYPEDPRLN